MIYPLYSINDAVAGTFSQPTPHNNEAAAMRAFAEVFKDVYSPQDYALFKVADMDMNTGEIIPCTPFIVCRATDFIKEKENND